ncbi:MAG: hypothetical protein IJK04_05555, partial [Kiritimatiellae bacterium]|nr:hypothetical protein [Kiritimatiellia bacterium]
MKILKIAAIAALWLLCSSFTTIHLMGDSTMAEKDLSNGNPERGWGMMFQNFLDDQVKVVNYAQNGRSTKSFIDRGLWDQVKANLKPGDWVFIEFGHNDAKQDDPERYAPAFGAYQDNLRTFVRTALDAGCKPVLLTPVARRWFKEGKLDRTKLLGLSGRRREPQFELAKKYGLVDYPSPAGGCKLTEKGFGHKLRDLLEHEGLDERRLVELLLVARRFRLPDGTSVILGRDASENRLLAARRTPSDTLVAPVSVPGPTALLPRVVSESDLDAATHVVCAWSRFDSFSGDITVKIVADATTTERTIPRPY